MQHPGCQGLATLLPHDGEPVEEVFLDLANTYGAVEDTLDDGVLTLRVLLSGPHVLGRNERVDDSLSFIHHYGILRVENQTPLRDERAKRTAHALQIVIQLKLALDGVELELVFLRMPRPFVVRGCHLVAKSEDYTSVGSRGLVGGLSVPNQLSVIRGEDFFEEITRFSLEVVEVLSIPLVVPVSLTIAAVQIEPDIVVAVDGLILRNFPHSVLNFILIHHPRLTAKLSEAGGYPELIQLIPGLFLQSLDGMKHDPAYVQQGLVFLHQRDALCFFEGRRHPLENRHRRIYQLVVLARRDVEWPVEGTVRIRQTDRAFENCDRQIEVHEPRLQFRRRDRLREQEEDVAGEVLGPPQLVAGAVLNDIRDVGQTQGPHDLFRGRKRGVVDIEADPTGGGVGARSSLPAFVD